jgi:hypothetical protein
MNSARVVVEENSRGVVMGKKTKIVERMEWVPMRFSYIVEADTDEEAIEKMQLLDDGGLDEEEEMAMLESREFSIGETSYCAVSEIDDKSFWKIKDEQPMGVYYENILQ